MELDRPDTGEARANDELASLAGGVFDCLGNAFPVCCLSDEFHYFPQIVPPQGGWTGWDDFTPDKISEVTTRLSLAERAAGEISRKTGDARIHADAETIGRMARTLREQLSEVRFHETQPTFHMTVLCTGLAASLKDLDPQAWGVRAETVPSFLKQAEAALVAMPRLFRDLGLEMIRDTEAWLQTLAREQDELAPVFAALGRFGDFLRNARTREDFLLPPEIVERIVKEHLGCGLGLDELRDAIKEEIAETGSLMNEAAETLLPGAGAREAIRRLPVPEVSADGLTALYRKEADNLLGHCIARGIVPEGLPVTNPLKVSPLPPYLRAIRAASAYSFTPANPSQKGTFYIVPPEGPWNDNWEELADWRMLTAHETYPGHHLLDAWRWHFVSPLRRPVENPLFYEGWACFAEELMRETGYFSGPADALLLAKRRYRRAVRGLVDLDLQTGKLDQRAAARLLVEAGFPAEAAASVVPKYALRPGYQVCYTFGLRRFLDLHRRYGKEDAKGFVEVVLSGGEIGFDLLEKSLHRRFDES